MIVVTACFRSETKAIPSRSGIHVVHTAMGDCAAADLARAVRGRPALLLSTGFCGGLAPDLRVGDLVLADEIRSGSETMRVDRGLVDRAKGILDARGLGPRVGPEACAGDVSSVGDKRELGSSGALAVDLESAGLARWAEAEGVRFLSLRAVLDDADEDVPFSLRVPLWASVLRHPFRTARVGRAAGKAALRLGAAVECLAEAWEAER